MDIKSFVTQADRIFSCTGDSCDYGCHENAVPKMIMYVKEHLPDYHYCLVSDWVWIDINVTPEHTERFMERGISLVSFTHTELSTMRRKDPLNLYGRLFYKTSNRTAFFYREIRLISFFGQAPESQ